MTHFPRLFKPLLNLHLVDSCRSHHRFFFLPLLSRDDPEREEKREGEINRNFQRGSAENRWKHPPVFHDLDPFPFLLLSFLSPFQYTRPLSPRTLHPRTRRESIHTLPRSRAGPYTRNGMNAQSTTIHHYPARVFLLHILVYSTLGRGTYSTSTRRTFISRSIRLSWLGVRPIFLVRPVSW